MESGYTEKNFQVPIPLNEPQGNIKNWNEMESGYTEKNFQVPIPLNEPQGNIKKGNIKNWRL